MILSTPFYSCHFVHTILPIPFCPMTFCPYTILPIPFCPMTFCPYHFAHTILSNDILSVYHFVHTIFFVPFCPLPFCLRTVLSGKNVERLDDKKEVIDSAVRTPQSTNNIQPMS